MSNDLIHRYADYIGRAVSKVNPYTPDSAEYAVYECGLLRAIIAQCILHDSKNKSIVDSVVERIVENRAVENSEAPVRIIRSDGK